MPLLTRLPLPIIAILAACTPPATDTGTPTRHGRATLTAAACDPLLVGLPVTVLACDVDGTCIPATDYILTEVGYLTPDCSRADHLVAVW